MSIESFWSSSKLLLLVSILKLLSMSLSQNSCMHVFVSKPCLPMCLKVHVCMCMSQSPCLLLSTSKLLSTNVVSKHLSTTMCLHEFWKVYEFWSSSQAWFTLPYSICKNVSKVMNFQTPQSSSFVCHSLFAWNLEAFWVLKLVTSHIVLSTIDCAQVF